MVNHLGARGGLGWPFVSNASRSFPQRQARVAPEQWLKANGRAAAGLSYECYLNDPQATAPEKLETDILIPLA